MPADLKSSEGLATAGGGGLAFAFTRIPEVWIRFLLALAGLILAFAAALFSTVARESGSLWGTLILASVALLLAVLVGVTTVPYLARRVAATRVRDAFDYEVTRVGIGYVIVVLVIGIAALNTGNNLLYIVVAAMLAAILISGFASAAVLRDLEVEVLIPEHVFARQTTTGRVVMRNPRRWLPSFSVSLVAQGKKKPAKQWQWTRVVFAFPPGRSPEAQWFTVPDRKLQRVEQKESIAEIFRGTSYFPYLAPQTHLSADIELRFERRGRYHQESFGLATRFPFAFLTKTRHIALPRDLVVFPPVELKGELADILPRILGEFESFARGQGADLYRIREYMPEDSARHVDWKATAKSGSLKVREFSKEEDRSLRIVFDNPAAGVLSATHYEYAVELAASLSWYFARLNRRVFFASQSYSGSVDVYEFLSFLAIVQPGLSASVLDDLPLSPTFNVVITARSPSSVPARLRECSHVIAIPAGT
jgi:uncharacterized protein (DUF58 family)